MSINNAKTVDFPAYANPLNSYDIINELEMLRQRVSQLKLESTKTLAAKITLFRLESIKEKEEFVKFYTGFPDYAVL